MYIEGKGHKVAVGVVEDISLGSVCLHEGAPGISVDGRGSGSQLLGHHNLRMMVVEQVLTVEAKEHAGRELERGSRQIHVMSARYRRLIPVAVASSCELCKHQTAASCLNKRYLIIFRRSSKSRRFFCYICLISKTSKTCKIWKDLQSILKICFFLQVLQLVSPILQTFRVL